MTTKIFPASEVAYMLRQTLGPIRAWDDCLTDMRLGKTTVSDYALLPACKTHDGRLWRPGYTAADIAAFIKAVKAANPDAKPHTPHQFRMIDLDPSDERPWSMRKLSPATMH